MSQTVTLEKVKRGMERMFIPNIIIIWDDGFKMYLIKPHIHTELEMIRLNYQVENINQNTGDAEDIAGVAWIKRYAGLKLSQGKYISESNLDAVLNSMGNCGLTYQITDSRDEDSGQRS